MPRHHRAQHQDDGGTDPADSMALPSLTLVTLLWVLFTAARGAPTGAGLQERAACAAVRSSSAELNSVSRAAVVEVRKKIQNVGDFNTSLIWVEAKDMCDPASLNHKSLTCIKKLLSVLEGYSSTVERVSGFHNCSALATKVKPVLEQLHSDLSGCVESVEGVRKKTDAPSLKDDGQLMSWQKPLLCRYVMERLFSFSIITARVFADGDPARHSGRTPNCL